MADYFDNQIARLKAHIEAGNVTSDFARSLLSQWDQRGYLSDKQMTCLCRIVVEGDARAKSKDTNKIAPNGDGPYRSLVVRFNDLGPGAALHLVIADRKLRISKAKAHSTNAGSLYLKIADAYLGRISERGFLSPSNNWENCKIADAIQALLGLLSKDFETTVTDYGKETGSCCLCGALLTNEESVKAGIGPICGGRWKIKRQLACEEVAA